MLWFECIARSKVRVALAALFCACLLLQGCTPAPKTFKTGVVVPPPAGCIDLRARGGKC